jgi:hypothetical protein
MQSKVANHLAGRIVAIPLSLGFAVPTFAQSIFNDPPAKPPVQAATKPVEAATKPSDRSAATMPAAPVPAPVIVKEPAPVVPPVDLKVTLPPDAGVRAAQGLVRSVYQADYKKASPKDRRVLIDKMIKQAEDPSNDATTQHAVLLEVNTLAASASDTDSIIRVMEELERRYSAASLELRLKLLESDMHELQGAEPVAVLADYCMALANYAGWDGDYKSALRAAEMGLAQARRVRAARLIPLAVNKVELLRELAAAVEATTRPVSDPAANLTRGCVLCVAKGDWDGGLRLIEKGNDRALAAMAEKDLSKPTTPVDIVAMADGYYDIASEAAPRPVLRKATAALRARYWYAKAAADLSGLLKLHAEKRLLACQALAPASLSRQAATAQLRAALLAYRWTWNAPDGVMHFWGEGSVSHRGMSGNWEVMSPRCVLLRINNGDVMTLWFTGLLNHYTSLGRNIAGDRVEH